MSNLTLHQAPSYTKLAVEKIAAELKDFKGDKYGMAVKNHVAATITHFCEQNERFAEVVYKTKRTLSDCCAEIMKGCGTSISDIDVYRGAVRNYFPNADIDFHMTITLTGDAPTVEEMERVPAQKPAPKAEKKSPGKKPAKAEKAAQATSAAPVGNPAAPVGNPAEPNPEVRKGTQTPEYRRPTPPPAPKPAATKPEAQPKKKAKGAYEDPNVIQLTLF